MIRSQKVFVGLSGGVDSAVAALRLKRQGYNVVGVFIKVWHPEFLVCNWEQERLDAMRVAAHLDIQFLTCDAEGAYKKDVADYFISEYAAGRTPNPDVMCNQAVKFGAFIEFAKEHGTDHIATGHYVRKEVDQIGRHHLLRGVDENKDQSYFLWSLTQKQLAMSLFPVGDTPKEAIRQEAAAARLPTATKKDSQGICFLGQIDIPEFLGHYIELVPGKVLLKETGKVIGEHQGALVYTLGQRHGFSIKTGSTRQQPHFVVDKNPSQNTITVSPRPPIMEKQNEIHLYKLNEIEPLTVGEEAMAQIRYRQTPFPVTLLNKQTDQLSIIPRCDISHPAVGQSCVLYRGEQCLGGGIIG